MLATRVRTLLDLLHRHRRLAVGAALLVGTVGHLAFTSLYSWHFVVAGSRLLWSPAALHLYALAPDLQMGPLTFAVGGLFAVLLPTGLGAAAAIAVMLATGFVTIMASSRLMPDRGPRARRAWMAAALAAALVWTEVAVHYGHLDDVFTLGFGVLAILLARDGRVVASAVCIGVAVDFKPWTLPLVALLAVEPRRILGPVALVGAVVLAAWLPFVVADPGTLAIAGFSIPVAPASSLHVFGVQASATPPWDRALQLVGATVLVGAAVVRRRWGAALVLLVAWRMILDPAAYAYYDSGLVVGTLLLDASLAGRRAFRGIPVTTLIALVGVTTAGYLLPAAAFSVVRTPALAAVLVIALTDVIIGRTRTPLRADSTDHPRVLVEA